MKAKKSLVRNLWEVNDANCIRIQDSSFDRVLYFFLRDHGDSFKC